MYSPTVSACCITVSFHCSTVQALMVKKGWNRKAFDITQAYTRADLPPGKKIALIYPDGFKRYDENGNELYMLLQKNLYGHPAASRAWSFTRDQFILEDFNSDDEVPEGERWSCHRCIMDPCLFRITKGDEEAIVLIFTDDVDMIGTSDSFLGEIYEKFNAKWASKLVDESFVLGVKREISGEGTDMCVELTMTAFVDGMIEAFKEHLDDTPVDTPFPDNVFISKEKDKASDDEAKEYMKLGYQRLCGMLLWAARNVFAECMVGISFLCRIMSRPSKAAWDAAIHMLKWLRSQRTRGLKFSAGANGTPVAFSDASNRPDPMDGKMQYGFCIMLQGAPVVYQSKKLKHVGSGATSHVEYMAIAECTKAIIWLRQLLAELHCDEMLQEAVPLYGDNKVANNLCVEDFVSTGNMYIYLPYHISKEAQSMGFTDIRFKSTKYNLADLFTKPVNATTIRTLAGKMCGYDNDFDIDQDTIAEKQ